ncbi:MAG: isocitrate dehydrogenase (NAD(+)) [Armatimonadetes bacterium CG2_30_66_41]|nr:MAG: isocitrate dehydrogenase (NAD(+)) [Armatimonadetes bacterium CG2_30_66_41]
MVLVHRVSLIPGDGIGPEVVGAAVQVIAASGAEIEWEVLEAGAEIVEKHGTPMPDHTLNSIRKNRVALKGPLTTPIGGGYQSPNVALRKSLELYACLRPVKDVPGVRTRFENVDLVVIRENTEGLYSGIEHRVVPGVVESLKVVTEEASMRICEYAFQYAKEHGRRKVTAVHKANIMKMSDGLFLECFRRVASRHQDIEQETMIVDSTCMQLVQWPERFDMLVMENLYGDILSEICAGLVGGLGVVPGANIGEDCAVFEAVHGSAPDIAGQNIANPTAVILSSVLMLRHLGEGTAADRVETALYGVLSEGVQVTPDLGGTVGTSGMAEAIVARM